MSELLDVPVCRLLPTQVASGEWQMAADEVMLETAATGVASLRFYRWNQATLSLGYFQSESLRRADPLLASLPLVRRATGGAALVHDRELTYALALPSGPPWQRRGESWLLRMHGIIAEALQHLGLAVKPVAAAEARKLGDTLCFLDQTCGDIVVGGRKIAGSAQRRHRAALLQHGAILFGQSEHTPSLPGLRELAGFTESRWGELEEAVLKSFAARTGWQFRQGDWTAEENARRDKLIELKYGSAIWNAKR